MDDLPKNSIFLAGRPPTSLLLGVICKLFGRDTSTLLMLRLSGREMVRLLGRFRLKLLGRAARLLLGLATPGGFSDLTIVKLGDNLGGGDNRLTGRKLNSNAAAAALELVGSS